MNSGYFVIDADGHVVPDEVVDWRRYMPVEAAVELVHAATARHQSFNRQAGLDAPAGRPNRLGPYENPAGWDAMARLRDMDSDGIDAAALFPHVVANGLTETKHPLDVCRGYNHWLAEYCAADPKRLMGVAAVPLAQMGEATVELRRCVVRSGFVGVLCTEHYGDRPLYDAGYGPLLAEADALDVPVMVHLGAAVWRFLSRDLGYPLIQDRAIGNPLNSIMGVMDVLCGGLLDRYAALRFAFLEGNISWLPWWLDRLDARYEKMGAGEARLRLKPSEYFSLGRVFVAGDADETHLAYALSSGAENAALFHTDYPHWDAVFPGSVQAALKHPGLSEAQREKFLGGNARRLFGARFEPAG